MIQWIQQADICLGIFGDSDKAGRVIPNKVFQILNAGKLVITRDSAAIRELLDPGMEGVFLVPPANPLSLAKTITKVIATHTFPAGKCFHGEVKEQFTSATLGKQLITQLDHFLENRKG